MSSTALAPPPAPLDLDHLARATGGEKALEREVLELFLKQSERIIDALAARPAELSTLSHVLNGSARAIGASRVADCATALEEEARRGGDPARSLAELREALVEARSAIEARLGALRSAAP
jgi:HPt (histidine-containing phosphotransfer) domain-containing protein